MNVHQANVEMPVFQHRKRGCSIIRTIGLNPHALEDGDQSQPVHGVIIHHQSMPSGIVENPGKVVDFCLGSS